MQRPEPDLIPDISRLATLLADPTRARMISALMSGQAVTATELARAGASTPQAASHHLAKMLSGRVVEVVQQGRHRYYRLASTEVAAAVEALTVAAHVGDTQVGKFVPSTPQRLKEARTCYNHLAGRLGVALFEALMHDQLCAWSGPDGLELTPAGWDWLLQTLQVRRSDLRDGALKPCLDWSERRHHASGPCATAMLGAMLQKAWLRRGDGRQLHLTEVGRRDLAQALPSLRMSA